MPMSPRLLRPRTASGTAGDSDVVNYIAAVELADGQALEQAVKDAIRDFILGCKTDGTWSAIKASCILMGARTLSGVLTPLVGTAPTNNNFVGGDYNRKTGLKSNGTNKTLDTQRPGNADPETDCHLAGFMSTDADTSGAERLILGFQVAGNGTGNTHLATTRTRIRDANPQNRNNSATLNFFGGSRQNGSQQIARTQGVTATQSQSSNGLSSTTYKVFGTGTANCRLAFYSAGAYLDLSLLDSRVTTLYNAIGAAIP